MSQTQINARPALAVTGIVFLGLLCGVGGWVTGTRVTTAAVDRAPFTATVESVTDDGRYGCLTAMDEAVLTSHGGPVCGHLFLAAGTDTAPGAAVRVRWFTTTEPAGGRDQATVETFALEPSAQRR